MSDDPTWRGPARIQVQDRSTRSTITFASGDGPTACRSFPLRQSVSKRMLAWTDRDRSLEPRRHAPLQGIVTIEKLAVNAVMAGCRPEYFPSSQRPRRRYSRSASTSTASRAHAPLRAAADPERSHRGRDRRQFALQRFRPGLAANATIGRAIRLVLLNVGGGAPGVLDRVLRASRPSTATVWPRTN